MNPLAQLLRLIRIYYVMAKFGLDNVLFALPTLKRLRFVTYLNPWNYRRKAAFNRARALRLTLEALGPIFIKLGQALSTRRDVLPTDIADELALLQDKVAPFSNKQAKKIVEREFGQSLTDLFHTFEATPLASASMAQVHAATLHDGKDAVVKILRPKMQQIIKQDVAIMYTIAKIIAGSSDFGKRLRPREIVEEFEMTLTDEMDLMREAANASQLRRNAQSSKLIYVPEIYWDYARTNVLVMERVYGIPISNLAAIDTHNINRKKLAERGVEIFFTQVFEDCFFHADMHPGNIFVSKDTPDCPQYLCVDFGIVGSLTDEDKRYLAENLLAFFKRDYRRVAELHLECGWVPPDTRLTVFESAIRTVCEPIFERPLKDISFAQVILRLFQTGRRFKMEVQPQLILLQKTLLAIEGLGRDLYPDLNLWSTAKPFLENWIASQIGPKALLKNIKKNLPFISEQLPDLPRLVFDSLHEQRLLNQQQLTQSKRPIKSSTKRPLLAVVCFSPAIAYGLTYSLNMSQLGVAAITGLILGSAILLFAE